MGKAPVISSRMARLGRLGAVVVLTLAAHALVSGAASADHCPPIDNPDPIPGQNTTYCHTPQPTEEPPDTPEPRETPEPTAAPTARPAPTLVPQGPVATSRPRIVQSTPESTPFEVEVPEENALETPEIVVDGPLEGDTNFEVAEPTASVSSWLFGFIFGFIIGGLVGRASWGLRRKRRQQIFG